MRDRAKTFSWQRLGTIVAVFFRVLGVSSHRFFIVSLSLFNEFRQVAERPLWQCYNAITVVQVLSPFTNRPWVERRTVPFIEHRMIVLNF